MVVKVCREKKLVAVKGHKSIVFGTIGRESLLGPGNTVAVVY
jgi:hypothetical protein